VNVYVDTDILVADAVEKHGHHARAETALEEILRRRWTPVISTHGLAETFSVLTRAPLGLRLSPAEAWQILQENVLQLFDVESLSRSDYAEVLRDCARQGWSGGLVFDAIHARAARKAKCARIYTFNVDHFRRIAPDLHNRILSP